jgi:hypothetical protein
MVVTEAEVGQKVEQLKDALAPTEQQHLRQIQSR